MLDIKNLSTYYYTEDGTEVKAVDGIDLLVGNGDFIGVVGPSGCGKSTLGSSILRLISDPGRIISGSICFNGTDLLSIDQNDMWKVRGKEISMIFQDPFTSLNPVITIGEQISETIRQHFKVSRKEAFRRAIALLEKVEIDEPYIRYKQYPHQLSGGMRQRVMIAIAISCEARLLIADEPTTALDVSTQASIMGLLERLRTEQDMAIIFISHNMRLVKKYCKRIAIMKNGKIVGRIY